MTRRKYSYSPLNKAKQLITDLRAQGKTFRYISSEVYQVYALDYSEAGIKSFYYDHIHHA